MSSRRQSAAPPISLFSFQDIITSVTGIMILITLLMSVELVRRPLQQKSPQPDEPVDLFEKPDSDVLADLELRKERNERAIQELDSASTPRQALAAATGLEREQLERLEAENKKLAESVLRARQENRIVYNSAAGALKAAWLIEITEEQLAVAPVGRVQPPIIFSSPRRIDELCQWTTNRNPGNEYFVLLIKPSGIRGFPAIRSRLKEQGFDLGFDVLAANQTAIDRESGTKLHGTP